MGMYELGRSRQRSERSRVELGQGRRRVRTGDRERGTPRFGNSLDT